MWNVVISWHVIVMAPPAIKAIVESIWEMIVFESSSILMAVFIFMPWGKDIKINWVERKMKLIKNYREEIFLIFAITFVYDFDSRSIDNKIIDLHLSTKIVYFSTLFISQMLQIMMIQYLYTNANTYGLIGLPRPTLDVISGCHINCASFNQ